MINGGITKQKKRSVWVTVLGWYFILQGWIALGSYSDIGVFAWVFMALFVGIGIGMLKLLRPAYIGALIFSGLALVYLFINIIYLTVFMGISFYHLGVPSGGMIVLAILLFVLTRKGVKDSFRKTNNNITEDSNIII